MKPLCALGLLAAGIAGCASSPPMRFYTLSPMADGATRGSENMPPAIRVARVTVPGEIDRPELVQRIDATRVQLHEEDRWAAPLAEMVRRTLSADLQSRAPAVVAGDPELLYVDIEELIGEADCAVSLRAAWSLEPPKGDQQSLHGYETLRIEPPPTCQASALPEAMSRALAELSNRIVSARTK